MMEEDKKKEIEKKQALMSIENNKLQDDIEGKNRELAISTMSMIKKNQFLSKIKSDLKLIDSSEKIFSVIKMIDRNLNNKDDWKFLSPEVIPKLQDLHKQGRKIVLIQIKEE